MATIKDCINVKDFELLAEKIAPKNPMIFANTAATDEQTMQENSTAFKTWRFQPRPLRDVSSVDTSTLVLGKKIPFPFGIPPIGLMKMYSEGGELDAARAAENLGTVFSPSIWSSASLEEIACDVPNCLRWCQIYVLKSRELTRNLVQRAEKNGFSAILLVVDGPKVGMRYRIKREWKFPTEIPMVNVEFPLVDGPFQKLRESERDLSFTWDDFDWLKSITNLPIVVKGIITVQGAREAVEHGAAAVWVSNHGGRQLDGVPPTIHALPLIAKSVKGKCQIFFDGGVRNGGDIAKAIALGADAVFAGRPIIWGVSCGGTPGAQKVLEILRDEFKLTMQLLGVRSIKELQSSPALVIHESKIFAQF